MCGEQAMSLREAALWEQELRGEERGAAVVWEMRQDLTSGGHGCQAPNTEGKTG